VKKIVNEICNLVWDTEIYYDLVLDDFDNQTARSTVFVCWGKVIIKSLLDCYGTEEKLFRAFSINDIAQLIEDALDYENPDSIIDERLGDELWNL
jgi:hypothetical protein